MRDHMGHTLLLDVLDLTVLTRTDVGYLVHLSERVADWKERREQK